MPDVPPKRRIPAERVEVKGGGVGWPIRPAIWFATVLTGSVISVGLLEGGLVIPRPVRLGLMAIVWVGFFIGALFGFRD